MTDYTPDPFKNFTPRQNPPTPKTEQETSLPEIDINDPTALRNLAKSRLIEIIQRSKATTALVPAIKELLDRIDGKAPQSVAMTVRDEGLSRIDTDKLIRLASMLDEPIIIPPMTEKI